MKKSYITAKIIVAKVGITTMSQTSDINYGGTNKGSDVPKKADSKSDDSDFYFDDNDL